MAPATSNLTIPGTREGGTSCLEHHLTKNLAALTSKRQVNYFDLWRNMQDYGIEIGADARTHLRLTEILNDPDLLEYRMADCRSDVEAALDVQWRYSASPPAAKYHIHFPLIQAFAGASREPVSSLSREPVRSVETEREQFEDHSRMADALYIALGGMAKCG